MDKSPVALITMMIASALLILPVAQAADIEVNGTCTLADAINAANTDEAVGGCPAGDGADTITLSADLQLQSALPLVTSAMIIEGNGYSINGNGRNHIIGVNKLGTLTLNKVTISNGRSGWGGAIGNLGGKLAINESTIRGNSADRGGAIVNEGTLTISNTTIGENSSEGEGGAIYNSGGMVTISSSSVISNESNDDGGAIYNSDGRVVINDLSLVSWNTASGRGGAILNSGGTVKIVNSSFHSNKAGVRYGGAGGVIATYNSYYDDEIEVTVEASTFVDNSATAGGAFYNASGDMTVVNSTFASNSAEKSGGAFYVGGGKFVTTIANSTFFDNTAEEYGGGLYLDSGRVEINLRNNVIAGNEGGDCYGRLAQNKNNLIGDRSCYVEISGDPMLGDLVEPEDGSPAYFPLLEGSPAIDAAEDKFCPDTDIIGTRRPQRAACDIGAYELPQ